MAPSKKFPGNAKRFVLFVAVVVMSAGGCATSPESRRPVKKIYAGTPKKPPTKLTFFRSDAQEVDNPKPASKIQLVGFNSGLVIAAPEVLAPDEDENQQSVENEDSDKNEDPDKEEKGAVSSDESAQTEESKSKLPVPPVMKSDSEVSTQQSVDYFVQVARGNHPKIQAARQRVSAANNVIPQVTALPDPMFNNTFWPIQDQALQTAGGRMAHQFGLQQGVPWPEKLRTKGAIASQEFQMAQAEVERVEREITEAVRLANFEVWYATRAIAIIAETRDLVDELTKVAEARYMSGGTQQDVLRAELESDRLDDQLVTLTKQKQVAQADLAALVQQPATLMPETTEELSLVNVPEQLDGLLSLAEQCSPELRVIASEIQRDRQSKN